MPIVTSVDPGVDHASADGHLPYGSWQPSPSRRIFGGSGGGVTMAAVGRAAYRPSASELGLHNCGRFQCAQQRRIGQKLFVQFVDHAVQLAPVVAHGATLA